MGGGSGARRAKQKQAVLAELARLAEGLLAPGGGRSLVNAEFSSGASGVED